MKFVEQLMVNLYPQSTEKVKDLTHKQTSFTKSFINPELDTFNAVKDLIKSQEQFDALKRRLSYLRIHEDKNIQKVLQNQRKIDVHYHAQELARKDKLKKLRYYDSVRRSIDLTRQSNQKQRRKRQQNLREAKDSIQQAHLKEMQQTKKRSQQISKSIQEMKQQEHLQKRYRRDNIVSMEEQARINVRLSSAKKLENIYLSRKTQISRLNEQKQSRETEMQQLNRLEGEMIERQSRSRMICEESEKRLRSVRKESSGKTTRSGRSSQKTQFLLPDINFRNKNNTNLVII